jgi:hypothetical protein
MFEPSMLTRTFCVTSRSARPLALAHRVSLLLTMGTLLYTSACSRLVDFGRQQCTTQLDCVALGFENATCVDQVCQLPSAPAPWSCLNNVKWPTAGQNRVSVTVTVMDVLALKPPEGMQVRICAKLDVDCQSPADGTVSFDAQGRVVATVNSGFEGYLEITAPTITPALFFVVRPVLQDTVVQNVLPVVSPQGFESIAGALRTTLDLVDYGHTYALASDCNDAPAAGVRLEIDRQTATTTRYYMINNAPLGTASATDASGSGGFLNLQTGFTKITGYVSATGARIGEASFIVRAGAVSYPRVLPTP